MTSCTFTIVRNSVYVFLRDGTKPWPRDAKLREAVGSHGKLRQEAYVCLRLKRSTCPWKKSCLSSARQPQCEDKRWERRKMVGHGDTRERLCLPPDHKANVRVDQAQSTVARSPRVSRVSITTSRASIRLGRALQDARDAPRENGGRPSRSRAEKRIKSAQDDQ